jgi:hypothetical protein
MACGKRDTGIQTLPAGETGVTITANIAASIAGAAAAAAAIALAASTPPPNRG